MNDKCPRCDYKKLKNWEELTEDEKMALKVRSSNNSPEERRKHRFCVRCGYETDSRQDSA